MPAVSHVYYMFLAQPFWRETWSAVSQQPLTSDGKRGHGGGDGGFKMPKLKSARDNADKSVPFDNDWQDIAQSVAATFRVGLQGPADSQTKGYAISTSKISSARVVMRHTSFWQCSLGCGCVDRQ